MANLPYDLDPAATPAPPMGLIVLQVDESLEPDLKRSFADLPNPLYITRIPSDPEVTADSLTSMKERITEVASLLPQTRSYPVVGYGCTSASAIIGSDKVSELVQRGCPAKTVTTPLLAATEYARHIGVSKIALLSPYIEEVNTPLRKAFAASGLSTDVFGTFGEAEEAKVARISNHSIVDAAAKLGGDPAVDAVFLSCTNLRTLDALPEIQERIGKPAFSSNQSLAWHMRKLTTETD